MSAARDSLFYCRRCGRPIHGDRYEVRIVLENAHPSAPREHVDKIDGFHPGCAAELFRMFDGKDLFDARRAQGHGPVKKVANV